MFFYWVIETVAIVFFVNLVIVFFYRVIRTFTMGKGGEATFLASPSEIQRIALTKQKEYEFYCCFVVSSQY